LSWIKFSQLSLLKIQCVFLIQWVFFVLLNSVLLNFFSQQKNLLNKKKHTNTELQFLSLSHFYVLSIFQWHYWNCVVVELFFVFFDEGFTPTFSSTLIVFLFVSFLSASSSKKKKRVKERNKKTRLHFQSWAWFIASRSTS